jgi:hypothetical protein
VLGRCVDKISLATWGDLFAVGRPGGASRRSPTTLDRLRFFLPLMSLPAQTIFWNGKPRASTLRSGNPYGRIGLGGGAWSQWGKSAPGDGACADGPMNLLCRFHDVHPGKWKAQGAPESFDCRSGPNDIFLCYRRKIQGFAPENRRQNCAVEQFAQLALGVWGPLTKWRPISAGPYAASGRDDNDYASLRGDDPPRFFQKRLGPLDHLKRVRHKETIY